MIQDKVMEEDNQSVSNKEELTSDHYGHYDLIMFIEDQRQPKTTSKFTKIAFFTGCAFFSIFSGLGLGVIGGRTTYRDEMDDVVEERNHKEKRNGKKVVVHEDPVLFATRALGWGTLIGLLGAGAVGLAVYGL